MAIELNGYPFDEYRTEVEESHEEIGGRDTRTFQIRGMLDGFATLNALRTELDNLLAAASTEAAVPFSLRSGRRFQVRRTAFTRSVARDALAVSFSLKLEAREMFEEASVETAVEWTVTAPDQEQALTTTGNAPAPLRITLVAGAGLTVPGFHDGERGISYSGTVASGQTLVFDGAARKVMLDGTDVTPYTEGDFPRVDPAGTTLTCTTNPSGGHNAAVTAAHHARWW